MTVVSVEIECHDEENTFHTTYKVNKYPEYARRLENAIRSCFSQECIQHRIVLNQNPPKGYVQQHSVKNWYVRPREPQAKVRYPRLGSFEVLLRCPSGFAKGVPEQLPVWSKLNTHRWPDPDRLANDLLRLLVSGLQEEDVSELVHKLRSSCGPAPPSDPQTFMSTKLSASSRPLNPPMFFSLSPRQRVPTPVEIRSPETKHRELKPELPPRPKSAMSPSRARPSSGSRQRPASAVEFSSSVGTGQWKEQQSAIACQQESPKSVGHSVMSGESPRDLTILPATPRSQNADATSSVVQNLVDASPSDNAHVAPGQTSQGEAEHLFAEEPPLNSVATPTSAWAAASPSQVVAQDAPAQGHDPAIKLDGAELDAEFDYDDDFEDDPGSPAQARTAEVSSAPLQKSQVPDNEKAELETMLVRQEAELEAADAEAKRNALEAEKAMAEAKGKIVAMQSTAQEVEEYDDEGFEDEDPASSAHPSPRNAPTNTRASGTPLKSDTASTGTRGAEDEEAELGDAYALDAFEEEENLLEESSLVQVPAKDRIVVEGQSYDYAEDNEWDDDFSDASRDASLDDANSVRSIGD